MINEREEERKREEQADIEAMVNIITPPTLKLRRDITNPYLRRWRETFVQEIYDHIVEFSKKLPKLNTSSQDLSMKPPQNPYFADIQMMTEYLQNAFRTLNENIRNQIDHFYVSPKSNDLIVIRNPDRVDRER